MVIFHNYMIIIIVKSAISSPWGKHIKLHQLTYKSKHIQLHTRPNTSHNHCAYQFRYPFRRKQNGEEKGEGEGAGSGSSSSLGSHLKNMNLVANIVFIGVFNFREANLASTHTRVIVFRKLVWAFLMDTFFIPIQTFVLSVEYWHAFDIMCPKHTPG